MSFNAVSFMRGLNGNDSFGRELNGLESVVGSRVKEVLRRCVAGSQRWWHGLRWETRSWAAWAEWAAKPGGPGWCRCGLAGRPRPESGWAG
jgi:hypothetical protein